MGSPKQSYASRFAFAGCAGVGATLCVHPLDVTRVQMQLDGQAGAKTMFNSSLQCVKHLFRTEGLRRGLYAGVSAGVFRQISYGMPRMAFYTMLLEKCQTPGEQMPFTKKLALGSTAGGTAALLGVPSEVCLVRMGADSRKPAADRRNYKNVIDALGRIAKEEGVVALWSGAAPTIMRACLLNAGQLGVYSEAKERVNVFTGFTGAPLQFSSSLISAVAAVGLSCPADVLKSRMQNMSPGEYSGMADCAKTLIKTEGVGALWKGFGPAYIKLAPHTTISFMILENLTTWYTGKSAM